MSSQDRLGVDAYVFDALMPDLVGHDRHASAFVVFMFLWRRTRGATRSSVVSLAMIVDGTGLAKRSVQSAMARLVRRRLVELKRSSPTAAASVTLRCDWRSK